MSAGKAMSAGKLQGLAGALMLFGALALAPAAWPQDAGQVANGIDFSGITSKAAALRLARSGALVKVRLIPAEPNDSRNIVYIPPAVEEARQLLIGTLRRFTEEDLIDQLDVQAEYRGASIVPARIHFVATHSRGGAPFEAVVEVW